MSIAATNWAWSLMDLPNATVKLVLMKHADHAHDDGTHTFQGVETIAVYALCSPRTVQRSNVWLLEHGYMREGDQSVIPDHYDKRNRPIAYELAMNEATRQEWEALYAGGHGTGVRDAAAAAGSKGGRKAAENKRGANLSPQDVESTPERTGDNLSPQDSEVRGDNQGDSGVTESPFGGDTGVTQTTQEPNLGNTPLSSPSDGVPAQSAPGATASPDGSASKSATKRGTRIPENFAVTADMVTWARTEAPDVDGRVETANFIDYWISKPGKDGVKLDWVATWRQWFRNAQKRLDGQKPSRGTAYDGEKVWGPRPGAAATASDPALGGVSNLSDEELERMYGLRDDEPGDEQHGIAG